MRDDDNDPGFLVGLGRAFLWLLRLLITLLLLVLVVAGIWFGYQELGRSFGTVTQRGNLTERRVELLRSDVDALMADRTEANAIATLEAEVTNLETSQERLAANLERQQAVLATLEGRLNRVVTRTATLSTTTGSLQEGLLALQADLNDNSAALDILGGGVDRLAGQQEELSDSFARVREDAAELAAMEEALTLFRAWELVARARLHLLQGNAGLAAADATRALAVVEAVETETEALQERLALVLDSLPGNPAAASRDLETAWEALDALIAGLLGLPVLDLSLTLPLTTTPAITTTAP